jgi:hypothetical protein
VGSQVWHFARHYLEMRAAMCLGGVLLNTLVFVVGPTLLGYPDLRQHYPGLALVVAGATGRWTASTRSCSSTLWWSRSGMGRSPTGLCTSSSA